MVLVEQDAVTDSLNNRSQVAGLDVVAGHGGCTNVASRLWLMPTSSTKENVGDLFGTERPLSVLPRLRLQLLRLAENDIPVSGRARGRARLAL